jgi:ParB/RepB/Spo0J family partition protein
MTSGIFHSFPLDDIIIDRHNRQRKSIDSKHITDLASSISENGLIHPIVLTRDGLLVAGECRTLAARSLGWTHIAAQYQDEVDEETLAAIEFEENVKRKDIEWQDRAEAIHRMHEIFKKKNPGWRTEDTARRAGLSTTTVKEHIIVYEEMQDDPEIRAASVFSAAKNSAARKVERRVQDAIIHTGRKTTDTHQSPILTANFHLWAPLYTGPKFNLIHCDFPYGIDADQHQGQNSQLHAEYTDTADTYWFLLDTLTIHLDKFCAESAHLFFWFSPQHYTRTLAALENLDDFKFDHYPLVWQRGENEGIAPDPARRPRRVYETAFFGWRGDRKIIRTKANSIVAPTSREIHPHEKSIVALQHFFEMCVDGNTRLFDPTCGSGSALRAARALGARDVFGLESNPEYADAARRALDP